MDVALEKLRRFADNFVSGVPGYALDGGVHVRDPPSDIDHHDRVGRVVDGDHQLIVFALGYIECGYVHGEPADPGSLVAARECELDQEDRVGPVACLH